MLAAASTDNRKTAPAEVRGHATIEYTGTIDREELKRFDPQLQRNAPCYEKPDN